MPRPELGLLFALFPPLMKIPSGPRPPPPTAASPLASLAEAAPPELPGLGPSGEIETRAARFPAGIAGGGTGAGVAESAISVSLLPARPPTSGAVAFVSVFCGAARGADIGFTGSSGFVGACRDEAILIAPACFSGAEISGAAAFEAARDAGVFGRRDPSSFAVSCGFGRSGCRPASCTMLESAGKNLGGSCGALDWISAWRGCVGCSGSERMVCRG